MQKQKSLMVKNILPGLAEIGKIKIGEKGKWIEKNGKRSFQLPVKLDHFKIKTLERGEDGNFIEDVDLEKKIVGSNKTESLKKIPVFLLFDDIERNIQSRYCCFYKGKMFCSGDGETSLRITQDRELRKTQPMEEMNCPCERLDPDFQDKSAKCKLSMVLSVMIPASEHLGGIYKFRSTSYNSYKQLVGAMLMVKQFAGQRLAGIPLNLVVGTKTVQSPDGGSQKASVVSLEFAGTMQALREKALSWAESDARFQIDMKKVEKEVLMIVSSDDAIVGDVGEFVDEFSPESVSAAPATTSPVTAEPTTTAPATVESDSQPPEDLTAPRKRVRRTKAQIEADNSISSVSESDEELDNSSTSSESVCSESSEVFEEEQGTDEGDDVLDELFS